MPLAKPLKLNLGSGSNKIKGFTNVDCEDSCKPDLLFNFINNNLPFKKNSVDEIVMFHTIEHIQKRLHEHILTDCFRVLKVGGRLLLSYPNFKECYKRWESNHLGKKEFWHATMFGRQLYPSDHHVCAMDPPELEALLRTRGFDRIKSTEEKVEKYNSVTVAFKPRNPQSVPYEGLVKKDRIATTLL